MSTTSEGNPVQPVAPPALSREGPATAPDLRELFGQAASSTWVVTGRGPHGPIGFTVISVASASLNPPMVTFNVSQAAASLATLRETRKANLQLLSEGQDEVAIRFSGERHRRFDDPSVWRDGPHGCPDILGVVGRLLVDIHELVDAGDSVVIVAEVTASESDPTRRPLMHHNRRYTRIANL